MKRCRIGGSENRLATERDDDGGDESTLFDSDLDNDSTAERLWPPPPSSFSGLFPHCVAFFGLLFPIF